MWLLMAVSGFPWYSTLTVTVKGVPAFAVNGAMKSRMACAVPQPDGAVAARTAINAQSRNSSYTLDNLNLADLAMNLRSNRSVYKVSADILLGTPHCTQIAIA